MKNQTNTETASTSQNHALTFDGERSFAYRGQSYRVCASPSHPEAFYDKWERLYAATLRAKGAALLPALRRLSAHESSF